MISLHPTITPSTTQVQTHTPACRSCVPGFAQPHAVRLAELRASSQQPTLHPRLSHLTHEHRRRAHHVCKAEAQLDRRDVLLLSTTAATLSGLVLDPPSSAAAPSTVFVAGAAGKTGRKVVAYLSSQGIAVRAGVRDIDKARSAGLEQGGKVTLVSGDVTAGPEALVTAIGSAQAVICATGYSGRTATFPPAVLADEAWNPAACVAFFSQAVDAEGFDRVDRQGTMNLVDAAKQSGVSKFVLLSSLLTNGKAVGQGLNPTFLLLNIFGGVLDKKHEAENYLRASGLNWTIVRPGGLSMDPPSELGNLIIRGEDRLFGLPSDPGRAISRQTVAEVLVQALLQPDASKDKVFEIVSSKSASQPAAEQWFQL